MIETAVHKGVPDGARRLIWDVFFAQAGRGVDFDAHLPWADAPDTRSVTIGDIATRAALVVRPAPQPGVAMIGFVCVDARVRGRGYGAAMLERAHQMLEDDGIAAALLWTKIPPVYRGSGYQVLDRDRFVTFSSEPVARTVARVDAAAWPGADDIAGLPAFATSAQRLSDGNARVVVLHGGGGVTLADWHGEADAVARLMRAAGYDRWSVNLSSADRFDRMLDPALFAVETRDGAYTMVRRFDSSFAIDPVSLADRI